MKEKSLVNAKERKSGFLVYFAECEAKERERKEREMKEREMKEREGKEPPKKKQKLSDDTSDAMKYGRSSRVQKIIDDWGKMSKLDKKVCVYFNLYKINFVNQL